MVLVSIQMSHCGITPYHQVVIFMVYLLIFYLQN